MIIITSRIINTAVFYCAILGLHITYTMEQHPADKTTKDTHTTHDHQKYDYHAHIAEVIKEHLDTKHNKQSTHNKQSIQKASVTINPGISEGEKAFLQNRLPIVKKTLEKLLGHPLQENQVPKIAFIFSGGGYRATLCTTGSLCAAEDIGLLDAITYITALSGSTWAVAPWISSGLSIKEFKDYLQKCVAKPLGDITFDEKKLIAEAHIIKRFISQQPITLVDPYGALLGNRLLHILGENRHKVTLSQQAEKIKNGLHPYPIYTAIDGRQSIVIDQTLYEFTPHTIGDHSSNMHIPTEAYGKKFKKGESINNATEKSLAYQMGTWGSAFAANINEILKELHLNTLQEHLPDAIKGDRPLDFFARVPNYIYKMNNNETHTTSHSHKHKPLTEKKHMKFVDAGLECNLPYSPVSGICSERKPDILIFLDESAGHIGGNLQKVVEYAKKYNHPLPPIDFNNIDKKTISIFKDEKDITKPIVIYMPRISDKKLWEAHKEKAEFSHYNLSKYDLHHETEHGFCKTEHFQYTPEHSSFVMDQTQFNMTVNKDQIINTIKWWVDNKK